MMLKALIVEQLENDGTLRSLKMQPTSDHSIVVSFADKYDEPRHGPFHFLDEEDEFRFREGFAQCRARRLGGRNFIAKGDSFHVETNWYGIPTERQWLSYYALSLPEFAIPRQISVTDPHRGGHEYRRFVTRDDDRNRFVIYLECASLLGRFDFDLACDFEINETAFASSDYHDPKTEEYGNVGYDWNCWLNDSDQKKVHQFFIGNLHMDSYKAVQAAAMGPNAHASGNTFQQVWQQNASSIDLKALTHELETLRKAMRTEATDAMHDVAIGEIASAKTAAAEGNGAKALEHLKNAGKWAFDVSTKIGVGVATAALKTSLGL